jgi:hypothetical protein
MTNIANITGLSRGLRYGKLMDTHMEETTLKNELGLHLI